MSQSAQAIVVSGASGQIGDFLLPRLQQAGFGVLAISRQSHQLQTGMRWLTMDFNALSAEREPLPAQTLCHLANLLLLPAFLRSPLSARIKRVIAFSSSSLITKACSPDKRERALMASLQNAEQEVAQLCAERGIAWTIFRPTLIYGCGRDQNIAFISRFIQRFGFFPLAGKALGLRQPVHADDLALACIQALQCEASYGQIYHLSGAETLSYQQMVSRVFDGLSRPVRTISLPVSIFTGLLWGAKCLPAWRHLSPAMPARMNQDFNFAYTSAQCDFAYQPRDFRPRGIALGCGQ